MEKKCNKAFEKLTELIEKEDLGEVEIVSLKTQFPECIDLIQDQFKTWQELQDLQVPAPSNDMHVRFYKSLNEYVLEEEGKKESKTSQTKIHPLWASPWRWAIAASLFAVGVLIGKNWGDTSSLGENQALVQNDDMVTYFTYVAESRPVPASAKLGMIQEIKEENKPDEKIIKALYQALMNDPNINVRLTAVETLTHFSDRPLAREYLIRAIPYQESALVQVALADAMMILEEKKSVNAWRELLDSEHVEPDVKKHISEALEILL